MSGMLDFFRRPPSSREILREMVDELEYLQRSGRHIYALRNDLEPFVQKFPRLEKINDAQVAGYLRSLPKTAGPRRRDNVLASVVQLSRFARNRNYLPEDRRSAAEKVRRIKPGHDVVIWTLEETKLLLEHVSGKWLPCVAIGLFAGLRTSETLRLDWGTFNWELTDAKRNPMPAIAVTRNVARKTRTDRIVPIAENLAAWLQPYRDRVGPLYPGDFKTNENARSAEMARIRKASGLPRKDNANRHSYGSYRLAVTKNYDQVAHEMGNSPAKVRANYNNPRPEPEGTAYFAHHPPAFDKIIPMHLPLEFR